MIRFVAGVAMGWLAFALLAQRPVVDRTVQPQMLVENQKVKVQRWALQPGERSPIHTHSLDHVYIVVHGTKIREHISDGTVKDVSVLNDFFKQLLALVFERWKLRSDRVAEV